MAVRMGEGPRSGDLVLHISRRWSEHHATTTTCSRSVALFLPCLHRYTGQRGELGEVDEREMYVHTARDRKVMIRLIGEQVRSS